MNNDKRTTRENAMLWWNNLGNAEKIKFWNKYPYMIPSFSTRLPKDLTGVEIERLYTAEHPTETETKKEKGKEGDILEGNKGAKWYLIPAYFKPFRGFSEIVIAEMGIDVTTKLESENKSLREANERLKEALKKNHQWALCLLADIEAGNVEYDEKYCLELNQDISETTNLLK